MADLLKEQHARGFTLIELLVVTAIITIVTGVVFANNTKFGGKILLQNLAYDVALSIRQAQVYGISVSKTGGYFASAYGAHFETTGNGPNGIANNKQFTLFADISAANPQQPNGVYTTAATDAPLSGQPYLIKRGYIIDELCILPSGGSETCSGITILDIVFRRPDPDACISRNGATTIVYPAKTCTGVSPAIVRSKIKLKSPQGDIMCVIVQNTGQISVQSPPNC